MFRFCLLAIASLVAASGTASAQFYSYGGYHHSYHYSYPQQQNYGNNGYGYGNNGYGGQRQVQYLVPVTYRVPIFVAPSRTVQTPAIRYSQPACSTGCNTCQ